MYVSSTQDALLLVFRLTLSPCHGIDLLWLTLLASGAEPTVGFARGGDGSQHTLRE